jgi:hypothetical protein
VPAPQKLATPDSPGAAKGKVGYACVICKTETTRPYKTTFRASGLDYPRATVITEPADVRISLLATGRFISIFSDAVLRFSARRPELKVLPMNQALSRVPVGIVTLKNRTLSPLTQLSQPARAKS